MLLNKLQVAAVTLIYLLALPLVCFSQTNSNLDTNLDTNKSLKFPTFQSSKNGEIIGELQDQFGYPVVGVIISTERGAISTFSGENGIFRLTDLKTGKYDLSISGALYEQKDSNSIQVFPNQITKIVIRLKSLLSPEDRIFTATHGTLPINFVPNSVAILSQKNVLDYGLVTLQQKLQHLPSVAYSQNRIDIHNSSGSGYRSANGVITMLDGIPFYSADNFAPSIDAIPNLAVSKIEVLKSPASGLYGNSASGGAINFITEIPTKNSFEIRTNYQTYSLSKNTYSPINGLNKGLQGIDIALKNNGERYDILFASSALKDFGFRQNNIWQQANGLIKANYKSNSYTAMRFLGVVGIKNEQEFITWKNYDSLSYNKYIPQELISSNQADNYSFSNLSYLFNTDFESIVHEGFRYTVSAGISGNTYFQTELDSAISYSRTAYASSKFHSLLAQLIYLDYGLKLTTSTVRNKSLFNQKSRHSGEIFTGFNFLNNEDILGNISARFELINTPTQEQETEIQISPNIGIAYQALDETFIRAAISRGYRTPTMIERFGNGTLNRQIPLIIQPNPKLQTQGFWHGELGARHFINFDEWRIKFDGVLFLDEMFAFISPDYVFENDTLKCKYLNISRARTLGAELIANVEIDNFKIDANIVSATSLELKYNRPMPAKPDITGRIAILYSLEPLSFSLNYRFATKSNTTEKLYELISTDIQKRTGISSVDLHSSINLNHILAAESSISLSLTNIFDTLLITDNGTATQVRTLFLGLRVVL